MITFSGIKKRLREKQTVVIYEKESDTGEVEQWISDGTCYYHIPGLPFITGKDQLLTMMDVKEKDRDKYYFDMMPFPSFLDTAAFNGNDMEAELLVNRTIGDLIPVYYAGGTLLVEEKALIPVKEEQVTEYFVRPLHLADYPNAKTLCVREDMFGVVAIIVPENMRVQYESGLVDDLFRVAFAIKQGAEDSTKTYAEEEPESKGA